jgi:hypothetical protein
MAWAIADNKGLNASVAAKAEAATERRTARAERIIWFFPHARKIEIGK